MKLPLSQFYLSFSLVVILLSGQTAMAGTEVVRPTNISRPTQVSNPVKTPHVKKQSPNFKLQSGYCLVNSEIEELDKQMCTRKRGKFFIDQRSAQQALDALQGFCCKDGEVKRSKRSSCIRTKGTFFLRQNEAEQECAATKGFCCTEGTVHPLSKGDCDRKKGDFFIQRQDAVNLCARQEGYCCKDGDVSKTTQGTCEKMRGAFFLRQNDAEKDCARQNGYCCDDGKVSRMNKGRCDQVEGTFSVRQTEARQACRDERGFCCTDGKIVNSSRGVCEQKNGEFSGNRKELAKNCSSKKTVGNARKTAPEKITTASPPKQQVESNLTNPSTASRNSDPKVLEAPKPVAKSKRIEPSKNAMPKQSDKTPRIAPGPPVGQSQLTGSQVVLSSSQTAGQIAGSNDLNIQTESLENKVELRKPEVSIHAEFDLNANSYWYVHGVNEDRFFWAKGAPVQKFGINATLKGSISCGIGTLEKADIFVLGGNVFYNIQEQTNAQGQFTLNDINLIHMDQIRDSICSDGEAYFNQNKHLDLVAEFTCKDRAGNMSTHQSETIQIPIKLTCDRREVGNVPEKSIKQYKHTCPSGYLLEGYNVQSKMDSRDWNNPLPCVKID